MRMMQVEVESAKGRVAFRREKGAVDPRPRRLVCRTEAPAWYATQVGRKVELRRTGTDEVLATIRPPAAWGAAWGWNLIDGGVLVERTKR